MSSSIALHPSRRTGALRIFLTTAIALVGALALLGCGSGAPQAQATATVAPLAVASPTSAPAAPPATPTAAPTAIVSLPPTPDPDTTPTPAASEADAVVLPTTTATAREETRATGEVGSLQGAATQPGSSNPKATYRPRPGVIALDPGHGGPEIGAVAPGLLEKDVNLQIALSLASMLREAGLEPVLTRDSDRAVHPEYRGGGYAGGVGKDLQARVDIANESGAVLFLSIHNNGHGDPSESGTEVYYNNSRPFSDRNLFLARLVQRHLVAEIRGLGHPVRDRGIKDDANFRIFRGRAFNIYVLGPGTGPRQHPPTEMPGVLGESLFLSNPTEAALLRQERTIDAIARGYFKAIQAYLAEYRS